MPGEGGFKGLPGIIGKDIFSCGQEPLHLGIAFGNEFDDQGSANPRKIGRDFIEGQVIG